jgi:hypothetical protein
MSVGVGIGDAVDCQVTCLHEEDRADQVVKIHYRERAIEITIIVEYLIIVHFFSGDTARKQ